MASRTGDDDNLGWLLQACGRQEVGALREIYEQYAPFLFGIILRLVPNRALAEEALQDVFLRLWRNAPRFDPHRTTARAWIIAEVRAAALERRIDEQRRPQHGGVPVGEAGAEVELGEGGPESVPLRRCLNEQRAAVRESLLLAYVEGCSVQEIAARLRQPAAAVEGWLGQGLVALKRCGAS